MDPTAPGNRFSADALPASAALKLDLMFEGLRYSDALGRAAEHALPNYYPYRFKKGERDPGGRGQATIPYLMTLPDGTLCRIKGNGDSSWHVEGDAGQGYRLERDGGRVPIDVRFEPALPWMRRQTSRGLPMAQAGISLHGDMMVINLAPGCEYFLVKDPEHGSMRCKFCAYGAPDERTARLGQVAGRVSLPDSTYQNMAETFEAVLADTGIRHVYLVGGSLTDWADEGRRFVEIARAVNQVNRDRIPVSCGSGALPLAALQQLHDERLVDQVCFNLEVWSEDLFARVCPGKQRYVGYGRWLAALEQAVGLWGRGRVYSAMVAGIEFEPEYGMDWEQAAELAIRGADDLCSRGVIPIYSLYWPLGGRDHPDYFSRLRAYFEALNVAYAELRARHGLSISDEFMCHRCAYMQLECDIDRVGGPV